MIGHQIVGLGLGAGVAAAALMSGMSGLGALGLFVLGCNAGLIGSAGVSLAAGAWRRRPRPVRARLAAGSTLVAVLGALVVESRLMP